MGSANDTLHHENSAHSALYVLSSNKQSTARWHAGEPMRGPSQEQYDGRPMHQDDAFNSDYAMQVTAAPEHAWPGMCTADRWPSTVIGQTAANRASGIGHQWHRGRLDLSSHLGTLFVSTQFCHASMPHASQLPGPPEAVQQPAHSSSSSSRANARGNGSGEQSLSDHLLVFPLTLSAPMSPSAPPPRVLKRSEAVQTTDQG